MLLNTGLQLLVPVGSTGRPQSCVWSPESFQPVTAHHLVCPLTCIHLPQLPIHQPAWGPSTLCPHLPGICHSAHHAHTEPTSSPPVPHSASTTVTTER